MGRALYVVVLSALCLYCSVSACKKSRRSYSMIKKFIKPPLQVELQYAFSDDAIVKDHCNPTQRLYMGKKVVLTQNDFEGSHYPMLFPERLSGPTAYVTSAVFSTSNLIMIVNGKVYLYGLQSGRWRAAVGVNLNTTHVSSLQCCTIISKTCLDVSSIVLTYENGVPLDQKRLWISFNGGFAFRRIQMNFTTISSHIVEGFINLPTISAIALVLKDGKKIRLKYIMTKTEVTSQEVVLSPQDTAVTVTQVQGLKGHLLLWTPNTLYFSTDNGQVLTKLNFQASGTTIQTLATNDFGEIAILLRNKLVIYGHISLNPDTIQLQDQPDIQDGSVIMFTPSRDLLIIKAISSPVDNVVDFLHCPIIIDQSIGKGNASDVCLIDDLESDFYGHTLYVDKTRSFLLTMNFVSRLSNDLTPLVALTNPQVLKANTAMDKDFKSEDGMHYSFKINVSLEQDEKKKDPSLYNSTIVGSFVTLTSDFREKNISCRNSYPQYVQFSIGCPPSKYIRISSNFTVCEKNLFSPYQLANNFTYTISKNVYDPEFLSRSGSATEDLSVYYNYTKYGCPILVNSKIPWIPLLELWEDDHFVEYVPADFVLFETHGMFNFGYLKTVRTSQCVTQPQNWIEMLNRQVFPNPNNAWTRKNYRNCRNTNGPPIIYPDVHYEVLKKDYWNKVKFPKYNGIFIFKAIVVDPDYSFCSLNTTFSVYVIRTAYRENRIQSSKIRYLLGPSFVGFYLFLFVVWRIMKMIQNTCF